MERIIGAIDIGSNTIKLRINKVENSKINIINHRLFYKKIPIRLGEDVFNYGYIGEEKEKELIEIFKYIKSVFLLFNVKEYKAYATSSFREAINGKEISNTILNALNIYIEIINETKEADLLYNVGISDKLIDRDKNYMLVDTGGGNTKIIIYSNGEKNCSRTFKIGTVRLLNNKVNPIEYLLLEIWIKNMCKAYHISSIIATGGNINDINSIISINFQKEISYETLMDLFNVLKYKSLDEIMSEFNINFYRADIILNALRIFLKVSEISKVVDFIIPDIELIDGIIQEMTT